MNIVDMHCHILPGVDDGAKDLETSLAMLEASRDRGQLFLAVQWRCLARIGLWAAAHKDHPWHIAAYTLWQNVT